MLKGFTEGHGKVYRENFRNETASQINNNTLFIDQAIFRQAN